MAYLIPFPREEAAERMFAKGLLGSDSDLLLVGRQFDVYGGPERLDLLALDRDAVPWIFEFKREIANEEAIAQLLSYGAFVAPLSPGQLKKMFAERRKSTTLGEAFQAHFDRPLPEQLSGQVNLVLAAFGFSERCKRVMAFLERGAGLVIGEMTVKFVSNPLGPNGTEFKLVKHPKPSQPISQPIGEVRPEEYFLLAVEESELCMKWDECRDRHLIALRDGEVRRHRALRRAAGLFVYLRSHGLVGYGVVIKSGRLLDQPGPSNPPAGGNGNGKVDMLSARTWEAQVQWHLTHTWCDAIRPMAFVPCDSGLFRITNPEQLNDYRISLGVD